MPQKSRGLFAARPANPLPGDEYTATDTQQKFTCFTANVWTEDQSATISALSWKQAVRLATTAAITLSGNQTIDGVGTATGDRVLVKDQAAPADNGIYLAAAGAWTRATDFDDNAEVKGMAVIPVSEGTANGNTAWQLETNDPIIVGSTGLSFAKAFPNLHGLDFQSAESRSRQTTTSATFQTGVQLVVPAGLTGTYRVSWSCAVDNSGSPASNIGEARLYNVTDAAVMDGPRVYQGVLAAARQTQAGSAEVVMAGSSKTFEIQWRDQAGGNTQGIEDCRIEFHRVS